MRGGRILFNLLGILFSTLPPLFATLGYFPLWRDMGGGAILSGITVLLLLLCLAPFFRFIKERLGTPSAPVIWLTVFITFFVLAEIAEEIKVIALIGFVGNLIGALFFRLAKRGERKHGDEGI